MRGKTVLNNYAKTRSHFFLRFNLISIASIIVDLLNGARKALLKHNSVTGVVYIQG